ncbi:MAG: PilW family protein, partial [Actinomycetes bacterium]
MNCRWRRWPDRVRGQGGFSLIEMMVSIVILGVLMGALTATMILGQRTTGASETQLRNTQSSTVAIQAMSRTIRSAVKLQQIASSCSPCTQTPFTLATPSSMAFYANLGDPLGPDLVSYTVVPDPSNGLYDLVEQV